MEFTQYLGKVESMINNSPWYAISFDESPTKVLDGCKYKVLE